MKLIYQNNDLKLFSFESYEDFVSSNQDTKWLNITREDFLNEKEVFFCIIKENKKYGIRLKYDIAFDENNFLFYIKDLENQDIKKIFQEAKEKYELNNYKFTFLKNNLDKKIIDYFKIKEENIVFIRDKQEILDISFIVPVRGRASFLKPLYNSFLKAKEKSGLKISFTIAEFSHIPEHSKFCKQNNLNYIWLKSEEKELFNKSLLMNFSALYGPKSHYLLFHDVDCLVQSDFFLNLEKNISNKQGFGLLQCFQGRRVLYLNQELTDKVINEEITPDDLNINMKGVSLPHYIGAPGGSILVSRNNFFEVGGYDPEFFQANAPEDIFFWDKIKQIGRTEICDNPTIEVFHMNHPVTYHDNPWILAMQNLHKAFINSSNEEKNKFINLKKEILKKYEI